MILRACYEEIDDAWMRFPDRTKDLGIGELVQANPEAVTLARIQEQTDRTSRAIETLNAADRLTSNGDFARLAADVQFVLPDYYRELGQNRTAELHLSRGLIITQRTPEIWLMPARIESLAELKTADGEYHEADQLYQPFPF